MLHGVEELSVASGGGFSLAPHMDPYAVLTQPREDDLVCVRIRYVRLYGHKARAGTIARRADRRIPTHPIHTRDWEPVVEHVYSMGISTGM